MRVNVALNLREVAAMAKVKQPAVAMPGRLPSRFGDYYRATILTPGGSRPLSSLLCLA
jgi:hypothetical protein